MIRFESIGYDTRQGRTLFRPSTAAADKAPDGAAWMGGVRAWRELFRSCIDFAYIFSVSRSDGRGGGWAGQACGHHRSPSSDSRAMTQSYSKIFPLCVLLTIAKFIRENPSDS